MNNRMLAKHNDLTGRRDHESRCHWTGLLTTSHHTVNQASIAACDVGAVGHVGKLSKSSGVGCVASKQGDRENGDQIARKSCCTGDIQQLKV